MCCVYVWACVYMCGGIRSTISVQAEKSLFGMVKNSHSLVYCLRYVNLYRTDLRPLMQHYQLSYTHMQPSTSVYVTKILKEKMNVYNLCMGLCGVIDSVDGSLDTRIPRCCINMWQGVLLFVFKKVAAHLFFSHSIQYFFCLLLYNFILWCTFAVLVRRAVVKHDPHATNELLFFLLFVNKNTQIQLQSNKQHMNY